MVANAIITKVTHLYIGDVEVTTCRHLGDMVGLTEGTIRQYMAKSNAPRPYAVLPFGTGRRKTIWRMDEAMPYVTEIEDIRKDALAKGQRIQGRPRTK